jgi:subtilisin family serine protease
MNANSDERSAETSPRAGSRRSSEAAAAAATRGARTTRAMRRYMIAPTNTSTTTSAITERLRDLGVSEIVRVLEPRDTGMSPVIVVRTNAETAATLRRTGVPNVSALLVERDQALQPATAIAREGRRGLLATATPLGAGFTTTIQVQGENEQPVERAIVQLIGSRWTAEGITGRDGKVNLTLFGELPGQPMTLLVKPRAGYWGLYRENWDPQGDGNVVALRPLSSIQELPWGGRAMRFDQLPPDYRGAGTRIALIDTGVATTSHRQLAGIKQGLDAAAGDERGWSQDQAGHGTPCAGILVAAADKETGVRGYAPGAELHVCKLGLEAYCSDLVAALDYCIDREIDVACIGYGCARGSAIVEQRLALAKRRGVAAIAATGSDGGVVQFPACSPQVMAIGAIGRNGTFPDDSLESLELDQPQSDLLLAAGSGLFVPTFSCTGPEIDLCAPGVAVISCQSPDGYAVCSGTSVAAPHVAALAALVLAHRDEFQSRFARRDARRVERLFQVMKETAQPLGDPLRTGAGLPDAARALGIQSSAFASSMPLTSPVSRLSEMRRAIRFAGLADLELATEPPRGPAMVAQAVPQYAQSPIQPASGPGSNLGTNARALREAMARAGLSVNNLN